MSDETKIQHFDPNEWKKCDVSYYEHKETGEVIHEETYNDREIKYNAITEYEKEKYE